MMASSQQQEHTPKVSHPRQPMHLQCSNRANRIGSYLPGSWGGCTFMRDSIRRARALPFLPPCTALSWCRSCSRTQACCMVRPSRPLRMCTFTRSAALHQHQKQQSCPMQDLSCPDSGSSSHVSCQTCLATMHAKHIGLQTMQAACLQ